MPRTKKNAAESSTMKTTAVLQYGEKSVPYESFVKTVQDLWVDRYQKKPDEMKGLDLYIKPEENKVYFVINNDICGDFDI